MCVHHVDLQNFEAVITKLAVKAMEMFDDVAVFKMLTDISGVGFLKTFITSLPR